MKLLSQFEAETIAGGRLDDPSLALTPSDEPESGRFDEREAPRDDDWLQHIARQ